ncbi:MAG TPA: CRISPR-associated ring nuclease Csm6, partial [Ignavibacteria bacterium]|nr:CRISPR-associated ring nuclease Csm6 [Ignavibacteria bacterium]
MKNILICVSGLTPQIITETLFCLSWQRKIKIDELYIVTTSVGREVILGIHEKIKLPPLKNELKRLSKMYKINNPKFDYNDTHIIVAKEQSIELDDIRNDKHNKLFPNKLCEFINEKSFYKDNVLYCSISGGRKSMSIDMAFALSLFGRENDKLLHVLTHENQEFKGFFPENKKQERDLELAELPFVRLRSIIAKETGNKSFSKMKFTDIVNFTQEVIKQSFVDKIILDCNRNEICLGEFEPVRLQPAKFSLYKFIIQKKMEGNESVSVDNILSNCPH